MLFRYRIGRGGMMQHGFRSCFDGGLLRWLLSLALLIGPAVTLGVIGYWEHQNALVVGAGVLVLFAVALVRAHPVWRPPASASVVLLYVIALVWLWLPNRHAPAGLVSMAQGGLLIVAVVLAASHHLLRTGVESLRRANKWCGRLLRRRRWPASLFDCRTLPEVVALREVVFDEVRPVLALLADPRPEILCAALSALEYRPHWRLGEAELILQIARQNPHPAVRAAAVAAMANMENADQIAELARFLRDPTPEVRAAAAKALLWNAEANWPFARDGVKEALAAPELAHDGPLFTAGRLPAAAFADLVTWAEEHAPLAHRAIHTLIEQYRRDLRDGEHPELASQLATLMLDSSVSPALRVELAALLRDHNFLTPDLLDRLTNLDQPGPIRLFAAEQMLRMNPNDPDGVDVLRGLARQPNREMALAVAQVLQNVLGMELGLIDDELPPPNSKLAAEIARRVLLWANGAPPDAVRPTPPPTPGFRGPRRGTATGTTPHPTRDNVSIHPPVAPPPPPAASIDDDNLGEDSIHEPQPREKSDDHSSPSLGDSINW
ncbi:MAG: HEAT repeat domain-containing protein [Gemmataceae bacterium]|nr:HEAT repeat domain-containing protein [Gemmata sp.]MDW8199555.1 HEAT repeat domain-containing protein [Gemmataceae bacterium]